MVLLRIKCSFADVIQCNQTQQHKNGKQQHGALENIFLCQYNAIMLCKKTKSLLSEVKQRDRLAHVKDTGHGH